MHPTDVLVIASALTASYLTGRLQPWRRLGDWAVDQIRHTGPWGRGGRQAAVVLAHVLTAPRTSRRIMRTLATICSPKSAPIRGQYKPIIERGISGIDRSCDLLSWANNAQSQMLTGGRLDASPGSALPACYQIRSGT